jgi:polysaccharide chain length determinant protein (PEP-CTERM system associated)
MFEEAPAQPVLTVRDYWHTLCRRRWWLLLPLFACWLGAWTASWMLPAQYQSETLILVEQQKIPQEYVVANVNMDMQERMHSMTQQILSRTRLQQIIDQFKLYPNLSARQGPDAPIDQMRKDIDIKLESAGKQGDLTAFRITYSAPTAQLAQLVVTQLTSLFINENIEDQAQQSERTTDFLSSELEDARSHLAEQEGKIKQFKGGHLGELPAQMESNVQILSGLQERHRNLTQTLNRAQEQKLYLESLLSQYRTVKIGGDHDANSLPALDAELARMRAALADAQTRYTEKHPDVVHLEGQIAKTEQLKKSIEEDLAKDQGDTMGQRPPATTAELQAMSPVLQIEGQLKANDQEIRDARRDLSDMEKQISQYQSRLNETPVREQQLADLTRDYDQSRSNYDALLKKQMQSQLATNLEKRQEGQQFRIIDPPSLPRKAASPDRVRFSLLGLLGGTLLGCGCLAGAEYLDDSVRGHDLKIANVRVLVGIPHLVTPAEEQRQKHWRVGEWAAAALMTATILLGNAFSFYKG